ncbi:MAG: hypothetical protein ACAH83_03500 [Alphaproteobacteria bacterium]
MGMFKDFLKAAKNSGPLALGMLRVKFHRSTMNDAERHAYEAISKTVTQDSANNEIRCSVPAGIDGKDAQKALLVLQLEYGKDWKVVPGTPPAPPAPPAP